MLVAGWDEGPGGERGDCDEGEGGVEPSIERERSQSSDCEPFECNESVDSEKSERSLDAIGKVIIWWAT